MIEWVITFLGIVSIYLTQQSNEKLKKYACIVGLVGQPFWLYMTWTKDMYGIFILTLGYIYVWSLGFKTYWWKNGDK